MWPRILLFWEKMLGHCVMRYQQLEAVEYDPGLVCDLIPALQGSMAYLQ